MRPIGLAGVCRTCVLVTGWYVLGCGARTPLSEATWGRDAAAGQPGSSRPTPCAKLSDCEGYDNPCQPVVCDLSVGECQNLDPVVCDDGDPCTTDSCDPGTGKCVYQSVSRDNDGDGYKGPAPGHAVGDPGACGDDCDDTSAAAHPGAKEICDGVDNDCNGIVDDGAAFMPSGEDAVQVDETEIPAGPGGLAWSGANEYGYLAGYWGTSSDKTKVFAQRLDAAGQKLGGPSQVTSITADATGGMLAWTGDRYGMAWSDRRDGNYEVYFNRLGREGSKLGPDVRVTSATGFSIYSQIAFNGVNFVLVWQDGRNGRFEVMGQRVDGDGNLVGDNIALTEGGLPSESPAMAVGSHDVGVAWEHGGTSGHGIRFKRFTHDLQPVDQAIDLTGNKSGVYPLVVWNKQSFVIAWYDIDTTPVAVYGAVVDDTGAVTVPARMLTDSPRHARFPSLLPLGDRLLLLYSDDRDDNMGYEIYARMLSSSLIAQSSDVRMTRAMGDSVYPTPAFGPQGDVGVLFRDDRLGGQHVFFTRLRCVPH